MKALEVGDLRLDARFDESFVTHPDEVRNSPAKHGLLAKEVRFRLLGKGRFEENRSGASDPPCIGERSIQGLPRRVLMNGDQTGHARPRLVATPDPIPRSLGGDHHDIDFRRRDDQSVANVEPVREAQRSTGPEVGSYGLAVHGLHLHVGRAENEEVVLGNGLGGNDGLEPVGDGLGPRLAAGIKTDAHPDAAVPKVEGLGSALIPVPDHQDPAP